MFRKTKIHNSNVWKSQNTEFQSLEKLQLRIPMFGKAKTLISNVWKVKIQNANVKVKIQNSDVWKSQNPKFQCLEKQNLKFPIMFGNSKKTEFQCLEKPKSRVRVFGKAKPKNSDVWKSKNQEYQC